MQTSKDSNNIHHIGKVTARLVAIKMLYAGDFSDKENVLSPSELANKFKVNEIYADMLSADDSIVEPDQDFLNSLYDITINNLEAIDTHISQKLKSGWTIAKIDPVVRSILRLATAEMLFFGDIPPKVIIDQYVSLTGDFYTNVEVGFVNALLDKLAAQIRQSPVKLNEKSE